MFLTISSAVRSGTPEESRVASVLAKRASASMRTTGPKIGARSLVRSHQARPPSVRTYRRTAQMKSGMAPRIRYQ